MIPLSLLRFTFFENLVMEVRICLQTFLRGPRRQREIDEKIIGDLEAAACPKRVISKILIEDELSFTGRRQVSQIGTRDEEGEPGTWNRV